jgi:GNAT superfamily N-acetyltransferase
MEKIFYFCTVYNINTHFIMIRFKNTSVEDRELIQSFTLNGDRMNCDFSIANIIGWRFLYNSQYAIIDDYLVFRFYADRHLAYMSPIARPKKQADGTFKVEPCDECSVEVIRKLREDAIAMGHPFLMLGVCAHMKEIINETIPDVFDIKLNRDYCDYIYLREKLISLSGKHLQSKRNHINKFKTLYPNYEYKPLTIDLVPECIRLEETWREQSEEEEDDKERSKKLSEELRSMTRIFNRWDELGMTGGTIFVDNKMVAFTFGNPINNSTFDVCVEKADTTYEGSFTIINQEFVKHLPEQYTYINREEDLGDEGLRRAKLSYKPEFLLEKYSMMEKHPLSDFEDSTKILRETKELWKTVFHDDDKFIELYFKKVYKPEYNVTCQIDHHVVGALQTLPYQMLMKGREFPTAYVSGVSTHPDYRNQGVGNALMRQAHLQMYGMGVVAATLIPAEGWLYDWYGKLGYVERITCTPPPDNIKGMSFDEFDKSQRAKSCVVLHDAEGFDVIKEDIGIAGEDYSPAKEPIVGMIRVINVTKALEIYAALHPDLTTKIHLRADKDIPANNAYYTIDHGRVNRTDRPCNCCPKMTIAELTDMIFKNENAEMNLMLN